MKIELNSGLLAKKLGESLAGSFTFDGKTEIIMSDKELDEFLDCDIHHVDLCNGIDWFIILYDSKKEASLLIKNNIVYKSSVFLLVEVIDKVFNPKYELEEAHTLSLEFMATKRKDGQLRKSRYYKEIEKILAKAVGVIVDVCPQLGIKIKETE